MDPKLKEACAMIDSLIEDAKSANEHRGFRIPTLKLDSYSQALKEWGYYLDKEKAKAPK